MNFVEFIFDNFFIVIVIAFGLINLISRSAKSGQEKQQTQQTQTRTKDTDVQEQQTSSNSRPQGNVFERMVESVETRFDEMTSQSEQKQPSKTVADQQKKQYEQLKKELQPQYASYSNGDNQKGLKNSIKSTETTGHTHEIGDIDINRLTTRKGLVQGMIMSEVLGPPRALKPYKSVINERKR